MKTMDTYWLRRHLIWITLTFLTIGSGSWTLPAADPPTIPLVYVLATDPHASEEGMDPGSFTVIRLGPLGEALTVSYQISGTAENGVDYESLSGHVTIPAEHSCVSVVVSPLDDMLAEGNESVVVGLFQPLDVEPPPYIVCWPGVAALTLVDNDTPTNAPPRVTMINPPDGAVFTGPLDLRLSARATDPDGRVRTVEFFANGASLGVVTNQPLIVDPVLEAADDAVASFDLSSEEVPELYPELDAVWQDRNTLPELHRLPGNTFSLLWQDVPAGKYEITAVATDNRGASAVSEPVGIEVGSAPRQPVVEIVAADAVATEPDNNQTRLDTALFKVRRSGGDPNIPLPVFLRVGGTAENGVDYAEVPTMVVIDPGQRSADVLIRPLDDRLVEGPESIGIEILPPICIEIYPPPPDCYLVGPNHAAKAVLQDNDSDPGNLPPAVRLVHPMDGDVFLAPADLRLVAQAQDRDGWVRTVEFFAGDRSLGVVTNDPAREVYWEPPFVLPWTSVPAGKYVLTALATDNGGAQTRSIPVDIRVVDRGLPPVVTVTALDDEASEGRGIIGSDGAVEIDTAAFAVHRTGPTDRDLSVYYQVGGTAENGVDYLMLSGELTIPEGRTTARLEVVPLEDDLPEGLESVVVTLITPLCLPVEPPPPGCYLLGNMDRAVAYIRDNDLRNEPPKVAIVEPSTGDAFPAGAPIPIRVLARDPDGWVGLVEFFDGEEKIGEQSIVFIQPPPPGLEQEFLLEWTGAGPGGHRLTVRATDNLGATTRSEPVEIKVGDDCILPVIRVRVPDPFAIEYNPILAIPPDHGLIQICRSCGLDEDLRVFMEIGGTAENGVDYEPLFEEVLLPAGRACVDLPVRTLDDHLVEPIETVIVSLVPVDCANVHPDTGGCYLIGSDSRGTVFIQDNDVPANKPPRVQLTNPPDGSVFQAPIDLRVMAQADDVDGRVRTVEFFADGKSLGVVTNHPWILDPIRVGDSLGGTSAELEADAALQAYADPILIPEVPFQVLWANVPPGEHTLTAVATDDDGAEARSEPVFIQVLPAPGRAIVEVVARDPVASEGCDDTLSNCHNTATFVISRSGGNLDEPLRVHYRLGGTATNGEDYRELPHSVVIPGGRHAAQVLIDPIDDNLAEGAERVVLQLVEPPCLDMYAEDLRKAGDVVSLGCYLVGRAHTAQAVIYDNDIPSNEPPVVHLVAPRDGDVFRAPATVRLAATAFDLDQGVDYVEFFEGTNSLGIVRTPQIVPTAYDEASLDPATRFMLPLYELEWSPVPAGKYVLTAQATDGAGLASLSEPVTIQVAPRGVPPVVEIETLDPTAMEQSPYVDALPDTATFLVTRTGGDISQPLEVFYRTGGSAEKDVDYVLVPEKIVIEAGETSARLEVVALDDLHCEGRETVYVGLVEHPCIAVFPPPPECYVVGPMGKARAVILDDDICPPNQPPRVAIERPSDGAVFRAPADLVVCAAAKDADGRVVMVEFFANDTQIGSVGLDDNAEPELFCIRWRDVPAGRYELTAVATDEAGVSTRSEPVTIRVLERPTVPVVQLVAGDAVASEDGESGGFVVTRDCCAGSALAVRYAVTGTAENGVDYELLTGEVTIPEGQHSARIEVRPVDDDAVEGTETVVASLFPSWCALDDPLPVQADCYRIGHPSRAVVFLKDNDSEENQPPLIALLSPSEGSTFPAPAHIPLLAVGLDADGWISLVEFFANDRKVGEVAVNFIVEPPPGELQTFEIDWENVPEGNYTLTARATDVRGAGTVSGPIHVRVGHGFPPPVVTLEPVDGYAREGTSNTASFRLRRQGDRSYALPVYYSIGGTAINGIDYESIPDVTQIPAGHASARILIQALGDNLAEDLETVVLRLQLPPDNSTSPPYFIGRPDAAAAVIVNSERPRPGCQPLAGGLFHICLEGHDGMVYRILATTDFVSWESICTGVVVDGAIHFVDPDAGQYPERFYVAEPLDASVLEEGTIE